MYKLLFILFIVKLYARINVYIFDVLRGFVLQFYSK